MNECPYADCVCLMPLVGELDLMEVQIMSFPMVCWQLLPCWDVELEMKRLELLRSVRYIFPSAQWPSLPY